MKDQNAELLIFLGDAMVRDRAEIDETRLEQIYDEYAGSLFRYAYALTSSPEDAEDAVQEVFMKIAREAKRLRKVENLKAYLFTSTRNAAYSILRSRRRRGDLDEAVCFLYADELKFLEIMDQAVEAQRHLYRESTTVPTRESDLAKLPRYAVFSSILTPVFTEAKAKRDAATATISGDQAFLALLAYKDSFHSYPATPAELRSKLGWTIKEDPFTGKDFIYKRKGNGFLLYSVGMNMKDDAGRGFQTGDHRGGSDDDDITWRMER